MKKRIGLIFAALFAVWSISALARQQQQDNAKAPDNATLKVTTRLVTLEVVAIDKSGHPVADLKPDEFQIWEKNGTELADNILTFWTAHKVEQKLAHFDYVSFVNPAAAPKVPASPKLAAGVVSNLGAVPTTAPPSILLLDALNTQTQDQARARKQMLLAIKKLPANTPIAVYLLGYNLRMLQDFSQDAGLLSAAVDKAISAEVLADINPLDDSMGASNVLSDMQAMSNSSSSGPGGAGGKSGPGGGASSSGLQQMQAMIMRNFEKEEYAARVDMRVQTTLAALAAIAQHVSGYNGRKNLIWISGSFPMFIAPDSTDTGPSEFRGNREYSEQIKKTADLLTNAQVAVYPVHAVGLEAPTPFQASNGRVRTQGASTMGAQLLRSDQDRFSNQATLLDVAQRTGGQPCLDNNDLAGCVKTALEDGSSYYELAYYPVDYKADGEYRHILVKTTRPGVRLSYRTGYYATEAPAAMEAKTGPTNMDPAKSNKKNARPEGPVADAIFNSPLLSTAIPIQVRTETLLPTMARYEVSVGADSVTLSPSNEDPKMLLSTIEIGAAGFDIHGGVTQFFQSRLTQKIPPADVPRVQHDGLSHSVSVPLNPGTARVRLALRDVNSGRVGTIDLIIPNVQAAQPAPHPHS